MILDEARAGLKAFGGTAGRRERAIDLACEMAMMPAGDVSAGALG